VSRRPHGPLFREYVPPITRAQDWTPDPCTAQTQVPALTGSGLQAYGVVCGMTAHHRGWHLSPCGWSWNPETGQALAFPTTP